MTVSTSINREFTIGELWRRAYQLAGLKELTQSLRDPEKLLAKDYSEAIVDELSAYGVMARQRTFDTITLTSGTGYPYSMAATTLDVFGDGMYIAASVTDITEAPSETPVSQVDQETWHRISAKSATGRPTMYYANRVASTITLRYWPIPTEAGRVRHTVQRHLSDMNDENATMDLETYWVRYIMYALAGQLAEAASVPGSKIDRLQKTAAFFLMKARGLASPHTGTYLLLDHGCN